jgi:ribonuclease P protein component
MISTRETFRKAERLCSRKKITNLFGEGNTFYTRYFKVIWGKAEEYQPFPATVLFIVPKKAFRHAVRRNLLKRRMKEAYRKNKTSLYEFLVSENINIALIVIYRKEITEEYSVMESALMDMMDRLRSDIRRKTTE